MKPHVAPASRTGGEAQADSPPVSNRPLLLDLFCGAGGAAMGYHRAGFDVIGVDLAPQPHYPFPFIQGNALEIASWAWPSCGYEFPRGFAAIHASPPCQAHSDLQKQNKRAYPELIEPTRELLESLGLPYIIENVEGAPLRNPYLLCGTMFSGLRVLRHRLFETNIPLDLPRACENYHPLVHTFDKRKLHFGTTDEFEDFVQVTGGGNCTVAAASDAMDIDWMNKLELNEAIPPAYTERIGSTLLSRLYV